MAVIFSASSDRMSFQHSSRIIGPFLHWLLPHLSNESVESIVFVIRKCAHLTEFAILGLLLWRALRKPVRNDTRPWSWPIATRTILLVMLYAGTDEFHQAFVPSRQASVLDVLLDATGAICALLLVWAIRRWRNATSPISPSRFSADENE